MNGMPASPAPRTGAAAAGKTVDRRSDLDALRGFAMLLGIVLHAMLADFPFPWLVQDPLQSPQPDVGRRATGGRDWRRLKRFAEVRQDLAESLFPRLAAGQ